MSENVLLFGKHRGKPLTEVMAIDPQYIEWLTKQDWFRERNPALFQTINTVIVHHSDGPDETPAHNALQALFLKPEQQEVVITPYIVLPEIPQGWFAIPGEKTVEIDFEPVDVFLRVTTHVHQFRSDYSRWDTKAQSGFSGGKLVHYPAEAGCCQKHFYDNPGGSAKNRANHGDVAATTFDLYIEVKPSIGDDYPAVIRQVKQKRDMVKARERGRSILSKQHWIVYADQFTGTTVTRDQMVAMLNHAGIDVIWHREP